MEKKEEGNKTKKKGGRRRRRRRRRKVKGERERGPDGHRERAVGAVA